VRFAIPADTVAGDAQTPATQRGLVSIIGKKLLSVLVFPLLEAGAELVARKLAEGWENTNRPSRFRAFTEPKDAVTARPLDGDGWTRLAAGPALLFVHGTFSTSQAFGGLDAEAWGRLAHRYEGRVFAFDHPTLSADPLENVGKLAQLMPKDLRLDVDVVAHSRGGLVARALACASVEESFPVKVHEIVHVGVPNAGTALADVDRHAQFVDRISTLLNLAPDGPMSVVADVLDGVLTLVKIIGCKGIGALPGLSAMNPSADWLKELGKRPVLPHTAYAIDADYEPTGGLLRLVRVPDGVADMVFQRLPNDMVVPTDGVHDAGTAEGFPIAPERRLSLGRDEGVWHCSYFGKQKTSDALLEWLPGGAANGSSPL
jgi:pimeloyl-ACP methyl ester carboxylesterase